MNSLYKDLLSRLLSDHPGDTQGLLLRLAWSAGLSRNEIVDLTWDQVDRAFIHLPDRDVPLEPEIASFMERWREICSGFSTKHVAVSMRSRRAMSGSSISQMVRRTLDPMGLSDVTLVDLRQDYISRQLAQHEWQYALRITGLPVSTYFRTSSLNRIGREEEDDREEEPGSGGTALQGNQLSPETERSLVELMQRPENGTRAIALALSYYARMPVREMVALTWDRVDFDTGLLSCADGPVRTDRPLSDLLRAEYGTRRAGDDPHVFLTERTRRPMDETWLTTIVRDFLIRNGIGSVTLHTVRCHAENRQIQDRIMGILHDEPYLTVALVADRMGISQSMAYRHVSNMVQNGKLGRINSRYFSADEIIPESGRREKILEYLRTRGPTRSATLAEYLHIGHRLTARILREMINDSLVSLHCATGEYSAVEPPRRIDAPPAHFHIVTQISPCIPRLHHLSAPLPSPSL